MNKTIKTRSIVKDVKTLDRHSGIKKSANNLGGQIHDIAENQASPKTKDAYNGQSYAESKVEQTATEAIQGAARQGTKLPNKTVEGAKRARELSKNLAQKATKRGVDKTAEVAANAAKRAIKQAQRTGVKASSKSVKTAGTTAKTVVKTPKAAAGTAKGATAGAKLADKNATHAARVTTKIADLGIKAYNPLSKPITPILPDAKITKTPDKQGFSDSLWWSLGGSNP